jgi:hypothetical protein
VFTGPHFDDGARHGVAGDLNVRETDMVGPSIDALDNCISGSRQFVIEAPGDEAPEHRLSRVIAMQRKA